MHWSPGIAPIEEIKGKQTKTDPMAEPDNSVKDDRILSQAGDCRNLSPASLRECYKTTLLSELSVQQQFHHKSDIWKAQFQTNSMQDETPHLKPTLSLFDLDAYKFNKIKWVIWVISGFPFLCNKNQINFKEKKPKPQTDTIDLCYSIMQLKYSKPRISRLKNVIAIDLAI